jgi:transposase InsO family protein
MLCVVDEFTREALAIRVARRLSSSDAIDTLADLFIVRGAPAHIRSGQGPEFVADAVKVWIEGVGAKTAYIEKASPWENGYVESFNGKLRDELLNGEVFNTLREDGLTERLAPSAGNQLLLERTEGRVLIAPEVLSAELDAAIAPNRG